MTNKLFLFLIFLSFSACTIFTKSAQDNTLDIYSFSENITEKSLYDDLAVLAHDSLQGRETGTIGEQKAARFLANRYQEMGLQPVGDDDTFFQHYELIRPGTEKISYRLTSPNVDTIVDKSVHSAESSGNFVTIYGGSDSLSGPIFFAGAGMVNEEAGINQYPDDVADKWLLILYDQEHTNSQYIQQAILSSEALGVIVAYGTDVAAFEEESDVRKSTFGEGGRMVLKYLQEDNADSSPEIAFNQIHPELAAKILGLENLEALDNLNEEIVTEPESFTAKSLDFHLAHLPIVNNYTVHTKNVLAMLEGSDPDLKDEVIVLSSHYDHVGIGRPDSTGDRIYNGADDDGSGTVATLQTAENMAAAKAAGFGPKRSILFLNVSGEEKGLLGSRFYSDHPVRPIENTIANINIDMIGRVDPEHQGKDSSYVYVIGGKIISSQLDSLIGVANTLGPDLELSDRYNDLNDPNQFYRRSDHWNFGRLGVPFVFFFNGTHEDYHRPQDHIEKITFGPLRQRTELVYNLTALLANTENRPEVDNQEFIEKTQVDPR